VIVDGSTGELVGCTELGLMRAPVGYATAAASAAAGDRVAYIGNVAVEPQRRRSGVGARLVGFACKWAQSQWARGDVFAHVEASNAPARALYAGLGFAEYAGSADAADASARAGVGRQVLLVRHAGASVAGSRE
jgi:ribosomal protein S18 acetylase RimI-like enzyme